MLDALEKVKELCGFYENSKSQQNEPKNLLVNLCDGLETFLGFNPSSKGYDGTGIVYSDLDRLCDAVMAFLSGVLGAVKDDDAVKTYYKGMNDTLQKIKNSMHNPGGLSEAVDAVSQALGEWDGVVKQRTEDVKKAFKRLLETDIEHFNVAINKLNSLNELSQLGEVSAKLGDCISNAESLQKSLTYCCTQVAYLDHGLENKLKTPVSIVEIEIERFVGAATNNELKALLDKGQEQLEDLKTKVDKRVKERVDQMATNINNAFETQINRPIYQVQQDLEDAKMALEIWRDNVAKYLNDVVKKVADIIRVLKGTASNNDQRKAINEAAETIKLHADALLDAANDAKQRVQRNVKNALDKIKSMDGKLKEDLYQVKKTVVEKVTGIKEAIGKLYNKIGTEYSGADKRSIADIINKIKETIEVINGKDGGRGTQITTGLQSVVSGLKHEYVKNFETRFTQGIDEMVTKIVDSKGVRRNIEIYSHQNKAGMNDQNVGEQVKKQITQKLREYIKMDPRQANAKVEEDLEAVQKCLANFAKNDLNDKVGDIVAAIDKAVLHYPKVSDSIGKLHLQAAIQIIVDTIKEAIAKGAAELGTLITTSKISQLGNAATAAEQLHDNLKVASAKNSGTPTDGTAAAVDSAITAVTAELGKQLPEESVPKQSSHVKLGDSNFEGYKGFVAQPIKEGDLTGNKDGTEGSLPKAIGKIRDEMLEDLDVKDPSDSTNQKKMDYKTITDAFKAVDTKLNAFTDVIAKLLDKNAGGAGNESNGVYQMLTHLRNAITYEKNQFELTLKDSDANINGLCKIKNLLEQIFGDSRKQENTLTRILHDAKNFNETIIKIQAETCIRDITAFIIAEVESVTKEIRIKAKVDYFANNKKRFDAMKKVVEKQILEINTIIENDKQAGIKGFLKTVSGVAADSPSTSSTNNKLTTLLNATSSGNNATKFRQLSERFQAYYTNVDKYIKDQTKSPPTEPTTDPTNKLIKIKDAFDKLLVHLQDKKMSKKYNYDNEFVKLRESLSSSLHLLSPSAFATPRHPELLDAVKKGLEGFVKEMGRVYVNGYDGGEGIKRWITKDSGNDELAVDGRNGAKVFLSFLPMLLEDMSELTAICRSNLGKKINKYDENVFGGWFNKRGYRVNTEKGKQTGELQDKSGMMGGKIYDEFLNRNFGKFTETLTPTSWISLINEHKKSKKSNNHNIHLVDILDYLYDCLNQYNDVCHLSALTSTKRPCSVYEMLLWLSGLPHHPVHTAMRDETILEIIENINKDEKTTEEEADGFTFSTGETKSICLEAYPRKVPYDSLQNAVTHICSQAYDVLCAIAGTGDADTFYASDYCNNSMKFHYPSTGENCLDMFLDILRRMLPTLQFLRCQCNLRVQHDGWYSCKYGKDVPPAKWPCKEHPNELPNDEPTDQPNDEPNDEPNCQPQSPLMSYLNDCLPGHLPHQLREIGCKSKCDTCSKSTPGMPCLTPLGFRAFSGSPKTGKDICDVLAAFFDNEYLSSVFGLVPTPPTTLPEHFGFARSLVSGWLYSSQVYKNTRYSSTFQHAFESSIGDLSINLITETSTVTNALTKAYGSQSVVHDSCEHPHLVNFTASAICTNMRFDVSCAPYFNIASNETYSYLVNKHAGLYVSWAVYLPWSLWELLNNLYKDFCNIFCADWGCRGCLRGDKCKRGEHGFVDDKTGIAHCRCSSIVKCRGASALLYKYGFAFGDASELNQTKFEKTCSNFCHQLKKLLDSKYFVDLFDKCDKFLFKIRAPFIWLNVALWLLSLLYLIHIMVIRLDLLHIKSHLHSPSSHRIAAQSLLAAARVNKLNKVFYLQP